MLGPKVTYSRCVIGKRRVKGMRQIRKKNKRGELEETYDALMSGKDVNTDLRQSIERLFWLRQTILHDCLPPT